MVTPMLSRRHRDRGKREVDCSLLPQCVRSSPRRSSIIRRAPRSLTAPSSYRNPILHADYSDPDVIRVGDRYYMVASTFHFSPGLPVLKSRDLVHWTLIGHALPRLRLRSELRSARAGGIR